MYLPDNQIKEVLHSLNIECANPDEEFRLEEQIQPCSIDLRLDNVFWKPRKRRTIDLRKSKLLELSPRRYWKKIVLCKGEYITLRPGQMILGRVYEKFTVPSRFAGKVEGRSSFARMGLGVHLSQDFINPGYRGHMPLQLVNHGPNAIRMYPYIPVCQLMLIKLAKEPSRTYGQRELQSKYVDDDGGPSYWWRDKRIRRLQKMFQDHNVALRVQEEILVKIGVQEPEILERFEQFASQLREHKIENSEYLLGLFLERERKLRMREKSTQALGYVLFPVLASTCAAILFVRPVGILHYIVWCVTGLSFVLFVFTVMHEPKEYLRKTMLGDG